MEPWVDGSKRITVTPPLNTHKTPLYTTKTPANTQKTPQNPTRMNTHTDEHTYLPDETLLRSSFSLWPGPKVRVGPPPEISINKEKSCMHTR